MIKVCNLKKTFKIIQKRDGAFGSFIDFFRPTYKEINAIEQMNFTINRGEAVGLIGPNGAGKSSIIKILTGILYPTEGYVEVMGKIPWKHRKELSYNIGTVFGQRSQLWFHLPILDSLNVLKAIYELSESQFRKNRDYLIETLKIEHLINTPVRKLSLGERMRCEIIAALIHNPSLLLLDEPTIGLDILSKDSVRKMLLEIKKEWGTTILLTSHDTGDIENVCDRTIIINKGKLVIDEELVQVRKLYMKEKELKIRFKEPVVNMTLLKDQKVLKEDNFTIVIKIDINNYKDELLSIIKIAEKIGTIDDILVSEIPLESVIKNIYLNCKSGI